MDELIFQEFKGTGNMELVLDRRLADRRVWPAIDIQQSGTRKEERLLDAETLSRVTLLRRSLSELKPTEAMESLVRQLAKFPTNADFLERIGQFQKDR
jgi:transcription termination factor Rho